MHAVDSRENGGVKEAAYYDYAGVGPCDFNNATSNYEELDAVSSSLKEGIIANIIISSSSSSI